MAPVRVLVVDDSVVVRKVLCEVLAADPEIEVAGIAADGSIALSKIGLLKPDMVTLDIEMPVMSGIETLVEIRRLYPKLPVIMFSILTERSAGITLEALALGASDYVAKPHNTGSLEETRSRIQHELIPKVKALCHRASTVSANTWSSQPVDKAVMMVGLATKADSPSCRIELVAVGVSTGGPNALAAFLPRLPADFPVPIVIVQHMPPLFTRLLAERLQKQSAIKIGEGEAGIVLKAGEAWIAPGDSHMTVTREKKVARLAMNREPPENSCRPAVDVLFRSVAHVYGRSALGVVLTGMGSDGLQGSQQMKAAGAQILVQDEASSVVWGMPGRVAAAGLAAGIYPLEEMAAEVERRVRKSRLLEERKEGVKQELLDATKSSPWSSATTLPEGRDRH